jgi:pimeloyl-ACP methyl ester carboxylesterase
MGQRAPHPARHIAGTIVFCHANGFPAGTYGALFERWRAAGWRVVAHERFGHDPRFPVTGNWPHLRDELLHFADATLAPEEHPVLVGHSMGGYLALMAACRRPGWAQAVVLLDAPIVAGWRAHTVQVLKATRLMQRGGPGRVSMRRRERWASREEAHAHFASKRSFAVWEPRVLADYIAHGLEPDPDSADGRGVRLAFDRAVETRIYNTLPHHLPTLLRRHPPGCPVMYVGGTRSPEGRQAGLAFTRALVGPRLRWLDGGHLFPMEQPRPTADGVLELLGAPAPR